MWKTLVSTFFQSKNNRDKIAMLFNWLLSGLTYQTIIISLLGCWSSWTQMQMIFCLACKSNCELCECWHTESVGRKQQLQFSRHKHFFVLNPSVMDLKNKCVCVENWNCCFLVFVPDFFFAFIYCPNLRFHNTSNSIWCLHVNFSSLY